ncbi:MAG TPA: type ISP restriction/modification enzyme [Pyrinomonadaceae bacterium]|nr:type ISP restriction/modification enzyme [Pyrinomonadaceae bacterium]
MEKLKLKPTHKPVQNYYEALRQFKTIGVSHEGAVRSAFQTLLEHCGRQFGWKLVPEWPIKRDRAHSLRVDGALVDEFTIPHGYWEAKDSHDDLGKEIKKKLALGYPEKNIIFQSPGRAILWQNGRLVLDTVITEPAPLVEILKQFFDYLPPELKDWDDAVSHFRDQVPEMGRALAELIKHEEKSNSPFRAAFDDFLALCRQSINPNLSAQAVEEMLIQHLLTERIFRTVFNNPDFTRRNVIASEIEKVIDALTSQSFSRDGFLQSLDRFYKAIDSTAKTIDDFSQKQEFLNTVYEKFFQGFSVKVADTHGIVYTPVSIVNFMVRSVEDILQKEFSKSLSSPDVHILDPFVGTGNFIVHIMQAIKKTALAKKYHDELHCNEVMLLPYYIASMNIEHELYERIGQYEVFQGICLADTFEIMEEGKGRGTQMALVERFNAENTKRVDKQRHSPIFVIIGNPPYNTAQLNENDNNKNRKYKVMDRRVSETYATDSKATLLNKLNDPYVKAIRWASDRIGEEGIVAFVTNNSFIDQSAFDGMRRHLRQDFDEIYLLDLGGNVRQNPKLSGTTHNVFGIQVGVSINLLVRRKGKRRSRNAEISYARLDVVARREEKYRYLEEAKQRANIPWQLLKPDENQTWLTGELDEGFHEFLSLGSKGAKAARSSNVEVVFKTYSLGVSTNRDAVVYDFQRDSLETRVEAFCEDYNAEVRRYAEQDEVTDLDNFLHYDRIKWSRNLKRALRNGEKLAYSASNPRTTLYRPFTQKYLYFADTIVDELGQNRKLFPTTKAESENRVLIVPSTGGRSRFWSFCSNMIVNLNFTSIDGAQCFPFYIYNEDGTNRRENLTDPTLKQFRLHYKDKSITKWDIFHYVYALLHHPLYRERYAANLKRELPRTPFAPDFRAFADIGKRLAEIHVNYEQQTEYPLERIEKPGAQLDWRVERMKLSKDKLSLIYNDFLTLSEIPPEVFEYRLGNRSALDWIIDQYQVSIDKRSGITNDPNRADDPQYIVRLIGQVITVSSETVKLVSSLADKSLTD